MYNTHALPTRLQAVKVNIFILASNKENRLTNKRGRNTEHIDETNSKPQPNVLTSNRRQKAKKKKTIYENVELGADYNVMHIGGGDESFFIVHYKYQWPNLLN